MAKPISIEKTVTLGAKITTVKGSTIVSTVFYPGDSSIIRSFKFLNGDEIITKSGKSGAVFIQFDKPYTGLVYGKVSPFSTDAKVVSITFDASSQYSSKVYQVAASDVISGGAVDDPDACSLNDPDSVEVAPIVKIALKLNLSYGSAQNVTLEEGTNVTVSYKSGNTVVTGGVRQVAAFMYTLNQKMEPEFVGVVFANSVTGEDEVTTVTYEEVLFTELTSIAIKSN